ncbi:hypothetical protein AB0I81_10205 [Nonomuraea sp. NPDC050404]|uniref:hypothetical protein n=1 Tax=Nonomuraea sp. NPDC050404 TaxID=3155783 RepID=UPI0033F846E3
MDELKSMWAAIPPAGPEELAGARRRLLDGMHHGQQPVLAAPRRVLTAPRLLVAAGVAAAVVLAPLFVGTDTTAYAVAKSPDGTVTVTVNELRDPAGLQDRLAAAGVKADVTFLEEGKWCAAPRFASVDQMYDGEPVAGREEMRKLVEGSRSAKAMRVLSVRTFQISPAYIEPGETLVVQFRDTPNGPGPWRLGAWLARAGTSVKPCTPVEQPR